MLSPGAYAKHRAALGLPGGSREAVRKAILAGRITAIVDAAGRAQIPDAVAADTEWLARTSRSPVVMTSENIAAAQSTADADRLRKIWDGRRLELAFKTRAAELVPVEEVRPVIVAEFARIRSFLLGVVDRLPSQFSDRDREVIRDLVTEAVEPLSEELRKSS